MQNDDPRMRPVFLFCTGRSGSTLLLRYVNLIDNVTVWGEHGGIVTELRTVHERLTTEPVLTWMHRTRKTADLFASKRPVLASANTRRTAEWANSFEPSDADHAFRRMLAELFCVGLPPTRRWGFKEIRYGRAEMDFLRRLFPDSRFIVLLRDPAATLASQFRHFAKGDVTKLLPRLRRITRHVTFTRELVRDGATLTFARVVHYEDLARDGASVVAELASFLAEGHDVAGARALAGESPQSQAQPEPSTVEERTQKFCALHGVDVDPALLARLGNAYRRTTALLRDVSRP